MDLEYSHWYDMIDDAHPVSTVMLSALIPSQTAGTELEVNVATALVAYSAGLRSLDRVRKLYVDEDAILGRPAERTSTDLLRAVYVDGLREAKKAVGRLDTSDRRPPTIGEWAASLILERLLTSFKSAHLLYRLGHQYDADSVCRFIIEQIAVAYAARGLVDEDKVLSLKPSKCIAGLTPFVPEAGVLYGVLSSSAHLSPERHQEFVEFEGRRVRITHRTIDLEYSAIVLLRLFDAFIAVWEVSQHEFLETWESIEKVDGEFAVDTGRPFVALAKAHLKTIRTFDERSE